MLPKETCLSFFPCLVALLASEYNVVHSYAAIAIERLLSLKEGGPQRFTPADLSAMLQVRVCQGACWRVIDRVGCDWQTVRHRCNVACEARISAHQVHKSCEPVTFTLVCALIHPAFSHPGASRTHA